MRKIFLALMLFTLTNVFSQFKLTSEGIVNCNDSSLNYIILNFNNKNRTELYNSTLQFLKGIYNSPNDAISVIENDMIALNGVQRDAIPHGVRKAKLDIKFFGKYLRYFDLNYKINLYFRDNKIKIESPTFDCYTYLSNLTKSNLYLKYKDSPILDNYGIYDLKNELKRPESKEHIEHFFNIIILGISKKNEQNNSDW